MKPSRSSGARGASIVNRVSGSMGPRNFQSFDSDYIPPEITIQDQQQFDKDVQQHIFSKLVTPQRRAELVEKLLEEEDRIYGTNFEMEKPKAKSTLVDKLTQHKWEAPRALKDLLASPMCSGKKDQQFYLLPERFMNEFKNHSFFYEVECAYAPERHNKTLSRPLMHYAHFAASEAGLNIYSLKACKDYLVLTFNFMELTEDDDVNANESWNDNLVISKETFTETLKDLLRFHLILVPPKDDTESLSVYKDARVTRKFVYANNSQTNRLFCMLGYFYTLD